MRRRGRGCGRHASAARRILYTARMATAPKPDPANFRLSVKDFGPIAEADVDFRPLTVFVGPSNTGKSYMAVLTYALHQVLMTRAFSVRFRRLTAHGPYSMENRISHSDAAILKEWERNTDFSRNHLLDWGETIEIIRNDIQQYFPVIGNEIRDQMMRCFGIDNIVQIQRNHHGKSEIQFHKETSEYNIRLSGQEIFSTIRVHQLPVISTSILMDSLEFRQKDRAMSSFLRALSDLVISHSFGALNLPAYYLPAERSGMVHAQRTVEGALIHRSQYAGNNAILLSGVLADFLQHMLGLRKTPLLSQVSSGRFAYAANALEKQILQGAIQNIHSETGHANFFYHPDGWENNIPVMNTSSMVSELAPVVLFLRHIIQPNSVLIIDEPESHLHPAMQVEFTRVLAGAVKAGLRVILTTHSEWVVETVGNLVELWGVPEGRRESLPGGAYALPPEDVGVWLFQEEGESGSVVTEVKRDPETGVYGVGYDDVAIALNNEWANAAPEKNG